MGFETEGRSLPRIPRLQFRAPILVAAWAIVGVLLNAGQYWLLKSLWLGAYLLLGIHAAFGLALLVWLFVAKQRTGRCVVAMALMLPVLFLFAEQISFATARDQFDRVLGNVLVGADVSGVEGVRYDPAQSGMVAFDWVRGIPDGGVAVVYDPSDVVSGVSMANWQTTAPELADLLNGEPSSCHRIGEPHYYICDFQ